MNRVLRRVVKPAFQRDLSVESLRRVGRSIDGVVGRPPRGTRTTKLDLGGFSAEWVSVAESDAGRVILYLPGGGFVTRSPRLHRAMLARICRQADADALLAFYRLAPEDPFPAGLDDCIAAYEYLLDTGVSPARIVIGGDSAGGCFTLSTLMSLRDRGVPLPAAAFTLSAVADLRDHHDGTRTTNAEADCMLTATGSDRWHAYLVGVQLDRLHEPLVSPVLGDFSGLPPLLMQASTTEILLDDSRLVAQRAEMAGVECWLELFDGMSHVWQMVAWLPESRRALRSVGAFVRHHTPA